jgi:septal ring factor EnvC (AmiA/AmiB activator)
MDKNIKYIVGFIILVWLCFTIYLSIQNYNLKLIDTSGYDKKVDSLNNEITKHIAISDSLVKSIETRKQKIAQYEIELANLKNKLDKEKKQHEKDINRINSMSNSDIAREFTNTFK